MKPQQAIVSLRYVPCEAQVKILAESAKLFGQASAHQRALRAAADSSLGALMGVLVSIRRANVHGVARFASARVRLGERALPLSMGELSRGVIDRVSKLARELTSLSSDPKVEALSAYLARHECGRVLLVTHLGETVTYLRSLIERSRLSYPRIQVADHDSVIDGELAADTLVLFDSVSGEDAHDALRSLRLVAPKTVVIFNPDGRSDLKS